MVVSVGNNSFSELEALAGLILKTHSNEKIFAFYGEMGSGKTTLIKEICKKIGVTDIVNSPTFAIVHEYYSNSGQSIYHFDFYRIKNVNELHNLGFEEYLYSDSFCMIEWPEYFENLLPEKTVKVKISVDPDNKHRVISF